MHARVERKVRSVEVREAVPEPRAQSGERVPEAEARARVEVRGDEPDSECDPPCDDGGDGGGGYTRAPARGRGCAEGQGRQGEYAPEGRSWLLEAEPGHRNDDHCRSGD